MPFALTVEQSFGRVRQHELVLGCWLLFCAAIVFAMVVVGGMTRLTQSGLSMVEWEPIMGIVPPLTHADWMDMFNKYRQSPEYLKINAGMTLESFKTIFYWEYGHRVLGRVIGLIYFIPLLFFILKGMVPRPWYAKLFALFLLGGAQGLMGWYMVKSGLVDIPHVSQYRLTAHLGLAIVIFSAMLWYALDFLRGDRLRSHHDRVYLRLTAWCVLMVFVMILSGGFVAGTKAGFIMNTFPTMNGAWLPPGIGQIDPWWRNAFENPITIQFVHRALAMLVLVSVVACVWRSRLQRFPTQSAWLMMAVILQLSLGISALVLRVPLGLGAAHQAGAVLLISAALICAHFARKERAL